MAVYPSDASNLPPAPPIRIQPIVDPRPLLPWGWLAIFAFGFALLNFFFMPVVIGLAPPGAAPIGPNDIRIYLVCFGLGTIGAEIGLLSIAAVFGPGIAWHRHLGTVLLAVLLTCSAFAGNSLMEQMHSLTFFFGGPKNWPFTLLVPILFCTCQLPLWPLRSLFCWRIAAGQCESQKIPRLSIAGILLATAVIALALGAVRIGHHLMRYTLPAGANIDPRVWWLLTGIWAAVIAVISLAVLPIFTLAIFRTKSPLWGVVGAAVWSILLFEAGITITRLVNGGWPFPFPWHLPAAIVVGFTISLIVPLLVVRLYGYRLLWGRS